MRGLTGIAALACLVNAWIWTRDAVRLAPYLDADLIDGLLPPPDFYLERGGVLVAVTALALLALRSGRRGERPRAVAQLLAGVVVIGANALSPASFFFGFPLDPSSPSWAWAMMWQLVAASIVFSAVALACLWWAARPSKAAGNGSSRACHGLPEAPA